MMLHVGFTGTQEGMSAHQKRLVKRFLESLWYGSVGPFWFHHGDCIGADAEAHDIARKLGYMIHLHPPANPYKRANCVPDRCEAEAEYLLRNRYIVDHSDVIIAAPVTNTEQVRSGTWSTVRYARNCGRVVMLARRID